MNFISIHLKINSKTIIQEWCLDRMDSNKVVNLYSTPCSGEDRRRYRRRQFSLLGFQFRHSSACSCSHSCPVCDAFNGSTLDWFKFPSSAIFSLLLSIKFFYRNKIGSTNCLYLLEQGRRLLGDVWYVGIGSGN